MGKTAAQVILQVRELIGDYQATNFDDLQVVEAINWAQNLVMRRKGFKTTTKVYDIGAYPTGALPSGWLVIKRALLVQYVVNPLADPPITIANTPESSDTVLRVLDESTLVHEDAVNEKWRSQRASFLPRRYALAGNSNFVVIPPILPAGTAAYTGVRIHYVPMATALAASDPMTAPQLAAYLDTTIPDYYQEAIRYAAVAYLMEKDTDQKSMQLKSEMMKSFEYHMAGGVEPLSVGDQDS